ncbi:hypothetical protein THRCLA_20816 [Thraustotheca clavata]|uniref:Uncharacterized protein n=1 Tax=Thraustotheca clavata TaxID=74557 RepID=A0A1W0A3E3_9STRA|nr:hypothetical protein THRCLA_20816 [Thraustotheca clavata]
MLHAVVAFESILDDFLRAFPGLFEHSQVLFRVGHNLIGDHSIDFAIEFYHPILYTVVRNEGVLITHDKELPVLNWTVLAWGIQELFSLLLAMRRGQEPHPSVNAFGGLEKLATCLC